MRISVTQDVSAPPEAVYARLADFTMFEQRARRRHLPVERLADDPPAWRIGVDWHQFRQDVEIRVLTLSPPVGYTAAVATRGVSGDVAVDIAATGDGSRLSVTVDAGARGLAGRMMMSTLGFARPMLESRLKGALEKLAREIEAGSSTGR